MYARWTMTPEGLERHAHEHGAHTIELQSLRDDYGDLEAWCARLKGVDPEHEWLRVFMSAARQRHDGEVWWLEFALTQPGGHECRVSQQSASRYIWFDGQRPVMCDEAVMRERVLGGSATTRAEIDVACQHELWEDAERLAWNLPDAGERGEALLVIREQRLGRDASGVMRLHGTLRQRQWAWRIREQALARLAAIQDEVLGQESVTLAGVISQAHIDLAMHRIRTAQRATFWIGLRDTLAVHQPAHFIEALVIGEQLDVIDDEETT